MKPLKILLVLSFLLPAAFTGFAQHTKTEDTVSPMGFWVVESNLSSPKDHIIRFYTNANELVYTESLTGVKLNVAKTKVRIKLKEVLETSILAWQKKKHPEENKDYVSLKLKD